MRRAALLVSTFEETDTLAFMTPTKAIGRIEHKSFIMSSPISGPKRYYPARAGIYVLQKLGEFHMANPEARPAQIDIIPVVSSMTSHTPELS